MVSEQSIYNLLVRDIEQEVIPAAQHYGIGIIPWSPLQGGLLAGVLAKSEGDRRSAENAQRRLEKARPAVQAYEDACLEWGLAPADVGIAWLLSRPGVTAPIIGPRTLEQFEGSLGATAITLEQGQLDRLDELFPGKKPAPMQYAW